MTSVAIKFKKEKTKKNNIFEQQPESLLNKMGLFL